jgi:branched-chain amino acid transport system substrate-binding protein
MDVVGKGAAKGVMKVEPCVRPRSEAHQGHPQAEVVGQGEGRRPEAKVGTAYYNYGVHDGRAHGRRRPQGLRKAPNGPVNGEWLNEGLRSITNFTAEGMLPPTTVTKSRPPGRRQGRIARWDGAKFVPATDWFLRQPGRRVGARSANRRKSSRSTGK